MEAKYAIMLEGKQTPTILYDSILKAEKEAIRLVHKEKVIAYILEAKYKVELSEVKITSL